MKLLTLILLTIAITQCKTIVFDKNPPFVIQTATYNNWVGKQAKVSGIRVLIAYKTDAQITFDSLFFANKKTKIKISKQHNKMYIVGDFNTSTKINDIILHANPTKEVKNKLPKTTKISFNLKENQAIISFIKHGKTSYFKVDNIKKIKSVFYP